MKIGIVGMGFMGRTHAAAWAQTPAQVVGMLSVDQNTLQQAAEQYQARIYTDYTALLNDVDVIDICTPTHLHHALVLQAAAAGKHIVCEKPLARTLPQAHAMVAACAGAGVHLLVGHVVRFFPEYAGAKAIIERGEIGQVAVIRLMRCSFKPARHNPQSWFHDHEKSGGMMLDLMIHDFDYARWVGGEVESVYARHVAARYPDAPGDYALVTLHHTSGALAHIEGGWAYPFPMFRTALEIAGSQGLIEHPTGSSVPVGVYLHQAETGDVDIAVPTSPLAEDPYTTQIKHFYDILSGKAVTPRVTPEDAASALQIALAAIESARTGRRIFLKELA